MLFQRLCHLATKLVNSLFFFCAVYYYSHLVKFMYLYPNWDFMVFACANIFASYMQILLHPLHTA